MSLYTQSQKGFGAIEAIIVIVVLALAGFGGWYVFSKQKNDDKNKVVNTTSEQKDVDVKALVGDIKTTVADKYKAVSQEDTPNYPWSIDYSAKGYEFKVRAPGDAHVMFTDKASWPIDYRAKAIPAGVSQAVAKTITDKGGSVVTNPPVNVTALYGSSREVTYYSFKNAVCVTMGDKKAITMFTLNCANVDDFVGVAKVAAPFNAYISQAEQIATKDLILATPEINPGATAGYEYATDTFLSSKLSASAFFYRKTSEQGWHYYLASQEGIGCTPLQSNADAYAALKDVCSDFR
jgi:hypothetical protein